MLPPTKLATFGAGKASEADAPDTRADQRKKRRKGSAVDKSVWRYLRLAGFATETM